MKLFKRALSYYWADWAQILFAFLLMLVSVGAEVLNPWVQKIIVDYVLQSDSPMPGWLEWWSGDRYRLLMICIAMMLVFILLDSSLTWINNFVLIRIGLRGLRRVRNELFRKLQMLSLGFHQQKTAGDLIYRVTNDAYAFQTYFNNGFVQAVNIFLRLLTMCAVMFWVDWQVGLVAVSIVPLLFFTIHYFGNKLHAISHETRQRESFLYTLISQTLTAIPLIKSFTREEHEEEKFIVHSDASIEARMKQTKIELSYWLVISMVFGAGIAGVTWLIAHKILSGAHGMTVGVLWVYLSYVNKFYDPLKQLSNLSGALKSAAAGAERVFEVLDTPEETTDRPNAIAMKKAKGELEFQNVYFAYSSDQKDARQVLQGISFHIKPGQKVAFIGASGVGKTTLLNLLPRFHEPTSGAILIDGRDIRDYRLKSLRENISMVLQESLLLTTTVAENIASGKPKATRDEIITAAKAANAHDFILRLPQGYDTQIGEGQGKLSGGERQRLALARAFLKDAPFLVLDEPTSALDSESEALVVKSLGTLMQNRTTLVVAHRFSTVRNMDLIIVLQEGRVTEVGNHKELVTKNGYYARVVQNQLI